MEGAELRQIRVVSLNQDNRVVDHQQAEDTFQLRDVHNAREVGFIPGPCQHNKKFACVFVPCAVPLFYIGGELMYFVVVLFSINSFPEILG